MGNPVDNEHPAASAGTTGVQLMYGADLLTETAHHLKFPPSATASACTMYHRFFHSVSPRQVSPIWAAASAVLLAGKHAGIKLRLRDVAVAVHARLVIREGWGNETPPKPLDYYGAAGYLWKQSVATTELKMLHELGFRLDCETPHERIAMYVESLREKMKTGDEEEWRSLARVACNSADNVMRIPVCVSERIEDLACACIDRAAKAEGVSLPDGWASELGASARSMDLVGNALSVLRAAPPSEGAFVDIANAQVAEAVGRKE